MSAYALSGGLFPPLEFASSGRSITRSVVSSMASHAGLVSNNTKTEAPKEVDIKVQEAKIDPARLIEKLTTSSSSQQKKTNRQTKQERRRPRSSAGKFDVSPEEELTQFELRIAFNGRTYTAVRSLSCILRLRQDLVSEMEKLYQQDDNSIDAISRPRTVSIPEVPRLRDETSASSFGAGAGNGSSGVVGRGFSFLQALISSYTPALEGWLRQVTSIVPPKDSSAMMDFLWEPLTRRTSAFVTSSSSTNLPLAAIEESENDCEED